MQPLPTDSTNLHIHTSIHHHYTTMSSLFRTVQLCLRNPLHSLRQTTLPQNAFLTTPKSPFTTTAPISARPGKGSAPKTDPRITLIRYHMQHPKTPRPLRFSRMRALRHWTIHRAWLLFRRKQRDAERLELERSVCTFLYSVLVRKEAPAVDDTDSQDKVLICKTDYIIAHTLPWKH